MTKTKNPDKLNQLVQMLKDKNLLNKKEINKFIEQMEENPVSALEWSKHIFQCSAELKVNNWLINAVEKNKKQPKKLTLDDIKEYLKEKILNQAQFGHNSTSVPSNFMNQELDRAWADLYNCIKFL